MIAGRALVIEREHPTRSTSFVEKESDPGYGPATGIRAASLDEYLIALATTPLEGTRTTNHPRSR
jgi:hypothetical protein